MGALCPRAARARLNLSLFARCGAKRRPTLRPSNVLSDHLDELVLEISEDGRPGFRVKEEVGADSGEWIEDHPKDPRNDYLSFMRFRAGGRTHVVRFSGPCT